MRLINKKGISPLIATILLIGFTVALAAVVITWGSGFVERVTLTTEERTTKAIACTSELVFEIKNVDCSGKVTIDNKGNIPINNLTLRFFDSSGNHKGNVQENNPIIPFEIRTLTVAIPTSTSKVEGLAAITVEGKPTICSETIRTKLVSPPC